MRCLLFAGAFNPPTIAHIEIAEHVRKELSFDKVILMPSKEEYIQNVQNKSFAFKNEERFNFLKEISINNANFIVSDFEIKQKRQPKTYETLNYLKSEGYNCSLLIGSDKLGELENSWYRIQDIISEFGLVVVSREKDALEFIENDDFLSKFNNIYVVNFHKDYSDISSSKVRKLLIEKRYKEVKNFVPSQIFGMLIQRNYDEK